MSLSCVILTSGRSIELVTLRMSSTYAGMLEGYPYKRINDLKVGSMRRTAERDFPSVPVHVVEPPREYPDGAAGPFGPVEVLPGVACIGAFESAAVAADLDPVLHSSALTVVWFQPAPETPSGHDADLALRGIDWEALAQDYEL